MPNRPRKPSRKSIIKRLDKAVSLFVIARDRVCVTCGSDKKLGCGHLFSRVAYSTRWDVDNVFCQCWPCNFKHEYDPWPLVSYALKELGQPLVVSLHQRYATRKKFGDRELLKMIERYQAGLRMLGVDPK